MMNLDSKSILYVGSLTKKGNSFRRFETLKNLGHKVEGIDSDPYIFGTIWLRFHYHLCIGPGISALNKKVFETVCEMKPEILLVDNKPYLTAANLKKIRLLFPEMKIVNIVTDDPFGKYKNSWITVFKSFKYYDVHFVQREINISEFKGLGAKRVELCYRSFDPLFHRILNVEEKKVIQNKCTVGFIGSYEKEREEYILFLVKNGINVSITGDDWDQGLYWNQLKAYYNGPSVYNEDYIKTINGMDIALHFLRKANRDQQDSRTFEIPGCGVFMLAERSNLHQQLFKEGEEADFFSSKEELLKKVKYYLVNKEDRERIAIAGYNRSNKSGYDHTSRLKDVIEKIYSQTNSQKKFARIVSSIYYDPDYYPPTINAILNLSEICDELVVITRNHAQLDFPYPSNVKLVKLGKLMTVLESEKKSLIYKLFSFTNFSFSMWKYIRKKETGLVVFYDAIPLLTYYMLNKFLKKDKIYWYHNHDMPNTHLVRKYSIGWFSYKFEYKAMKQIKYFSLPSDDRLKFYPNWVSKENYFSIPNYPSLKVYNRKKNPAFQNNEIRIIFQGTIGEEHCLEELISILNSKIEGKTLKLILKGSVRPHYKKSLNDLATIHGVSDKLEWIGLGPYCELPAVTSSCDIGIAIYIGSDNVRKTLGTASNKIYEFAALGLPVILYDNEQFRKYLDNYPWAFFSDGSGESLRNCINQIVLNYVQLSINARQSFEASLNFENSFTNVISRLSTDIQL